MVIASCCFLNDTVRGTLPLRSHRTVYRGFNEINDLPKKQGFSLFIQETDQSGG